MFLFELGHRETTALQETLVELRRHLNISAMPGSLLRLWHRSAVETHRSRRCRRRCRRCRHRTTIRGSCCRNVVSAHLSVPQWKREFDGFELVVSRRAHRASSRDLVIRKMRELLIASNRSFCNIAPTSLQSRVIDRELRCISLSGEREIQSK